MTTKQRRVHFIVWLVLGPLLLGALAYAAASRPEDPGVRAWPEEARP